MENQIGAQGAVRQCASYPEHIGEKTKVQGSDAKGIRSNVLWHLQCRFRSEEGQSIVELALAFMLFVFLALAVVDFGHLFFVRMAVQNALQEAARYGSTGNHLPDPNNPGGTPLSRIVSIEDTLQNDSMGINITNISISSVTGGTSSTTSAGGPGGMLTVSATVNMPLLTPLIGRLFPNGQYTFTTSVTIMNEPFQPSLTT
jgi:Flp pilus assembly protein TadG